MEKTKKIKLFIGLFYLILVIVFLFLFFSKFSLQEITSYEFIKKNRLYFLELKNSNLFLISFIFLFLTIGYLALYLGELFSKKLFTKKPSLKARVLVLLSGETGIRTLATLTR